MKPNVFKGYAFKVNWEIVKIRKLIKDNKIQYQVSFKAKLAEKKLKFQMRNQSKNPTQSQ